MTMDTDRDNRGGTGEITEELLSAYVDGEVNANQQSLVEDWLEHHPDDRTLVEAWRADRQALTALYRPVLEERPPEALRATVLGRREQPRWAMAAAAAGLLLTGAVGGGAGVWHWQQQHHAQQLALLQVQLAPGTSQGWTQRAAYAHRIYVAEPRHPVEVKAQEEHLARWLTRRIDIPVKLFDLQAQGFELVGGRLLPDGPGKSAQLMYQDAEKRRVTVYLRKPEKGADTSFKFEQLGPLGMFYWVEEGAGYALVGELPKETLLELAQSIYKQHPGALPSAPAVVPAPPAAQPAAPPPAPPGTRG
jgi:anti-sigma factor RsiW